MKKVKALQAMLLACSFVFAGSVVAAGASDEALAITCAGCHGTNGVSNGPASPTLAGMSKPLMIEAMKGFKSGEIPSTIMGRIAKGYTDGQFEQMANYFSAQKFVAANQASDAALAAKGAKLHDKYCEKCHSDGGSVSAAQEDEVGVLAGQWAPYIHFSLNDFLAGNRAAPKRMKKKLTKLHKKEGDAGIKALLAFYASQK